MRGYLQRLLGRCTTYVCSGFYFPDTCLCLLHEQRGISGVVNTDFRQLGRRSDVRTITVLVRLLIRVHGWQVCSKRKDWYDLNRWGNIGEPQ